MCSDRSAVTNIFREVIYIVMLIIEEGRARIET